MKLDLGCGKNKKEGFLGVDVRAFEGVDVVVNLAEPLVADGNWVKEPGYARWPWDDESVDEVNCSHFIEHLTAPERIHFVNELYRVLKTGHMATIVTPHWCSTRAYGDLTHQWPPVCEMWFFYLKREWREENAPHNDFYRCNFETTWGYGMHVSLVTRNQDFQQFALNYYKEAAADLHATLIKRA